MSSRSFAPAVALLLGAMLLVGCGGSDSDGGKATLEGGTGSDQAAVKTVVNKLRKFTKQGNAKGICSLFQQQRMEEWVGDQCVEIFRQGLRNKPDPKTYQIQELKLDGDKATATLGFGEVKLSRIDGQWYLDTPEVDLGTSKE